MMGWLFDFLIIGSILLWLIKLSFDGSLCVNNAGTLPL